MPYADRADQARTSRAHYEANKDVYKQRAAAARKVSRVRVRAFLHEQKRSPCADCGLSYPYYVMQFDHRGDQPKSFTIGDRLDRALVVIKMEVEKCDVVCANCHAERTHQRRVAAGEDE